MTGLTQFTEVFGAMTIADFTQLCLAVVFLYGVYRKISKYIVDKHASESLKEEKVNAALRAIE